MMRFTQTYSVHEQAGETTYDLNFTNKELDRDLGLNYFGARYYHPELPRFLSVDPIGGKSEIPISWNRYLYCRNDPINYFDPDGRTWYYVQETGELAHMNDSRGSVERHIASGYSGNGDHINNPDSDNLRNKGPVPSGAYRIGKLRKHKSKGPAVMNLSVLNKTDAKGRDNFLIHGDNRCGDNSASEGCIILDRNTRNTIGNSEDDLLVVVNQSEDMHDIKVNSILNVALTNVQMAGNTVKVPEYIPLPSQ